MQGRKLDCKSIRRFAHVMTFVPEDISLLTIRTHGRWRYQELEAL